MALPASTSSLESSHDCALPRCLSPGNTKYVSGRGSIVFATHFQIPIYTTTIKDTKGNEEAMSADLTATIDILI